MATGGNQEHGGDQEWRTTVIRDTVIGSTTVTRNGDREYDGNREHGDREHGGDQQW